MSAFQSYIKHWTTVFAFTWIFALPQKASVKSLSFVSLCNRIKTESSIYPNYSKNGYFQSQNLWLWKLSLRMCESMEIIKMNNSNTSFCHIFTGGVIAGRWTIVFVREKMFNLGLWAFLKFFGRCSIWPKAMHQV